MYIQSALNGPEGSVVTYFFRGDQFVTFDWDLERAFLGGKSITDDWILPLSFQPLESPYRFDAALSGHESKVNQYRHYSYFFHGADYIRHDWRDNPPPARPIQVQSDLSAWHLPSPFNMGVDAAFNGKLSRTGYAYFFKGNQYAKYNWMEDKLEYVKPLSSMLNGMPVDFAQGIEAAVSGLGSYGDYGYLFKGDQYIRFHWDSLNVDNERPIVDNWLGLAELLLAGQAKSKAFGWLWTAVSKLEAYIDVLAANASDSFMEATLQTHFHIPPSLPNSEKVGRINEILSNYEKVDRALHRAPEIFEISQTISDPAATVYNVRIYFSKEFVLTGPAARAAIIIHEGIHFVDELATETNDIPEWYLTDEVADSLSLPRQDTIPEIITRYDTMTMAMALHNPSSYASFAQHISYNYDTRYGSARQDPIPGYW
ncbi:hemopexin repeat-containing protein [Paenibacillus mendelii]|uniref:Hemopexin repeat-containing protein n=1 Tax=Paenibacillus mendelii TaxID=206163 RepID=A0ABV6JCQ7_9BACL|nr:hemopexin repeat-containing protein [Paenibacillus mendelii]MCQ6563993.1 hemopexin repeat-containing protein [Paenibacillus mendelii]